MALAVPPECCSAVRFDPIELVVATPCWRRAIFVAKCAAVAASFVGAAAATVPSMWKAAVAKYS